MSTLAEQLAQVQEARRSVIAALITVHGFLDTPYPDDPRWTPWTRFIEPALRGLDETKAALDHIEQQLAQIEEALEQIAEQQPKTLDWLRAHGIIFEGPLGTRIGNWEHVAFSIYTDLCETDSIARAALDYRRRA